MAVHKIFFQKSTWAYRVGFHPHRCISLPFFLQYRIDPIRLWHRTIISSLEVSQLDGRAYQNMDTLGSSWLHYGVHAIPKQT